MSSLRIACSYCRSIMLLRVDVIEIKGRSALVGPPLKCTNCGSVTQIEIATKRKSKGKAMRAAEAEHDAKYREQLELQRKANETIGTALLLQSGCICASYASAGERSGSTHNGIGSGHLLSTGWSRDDKRGGMMPTVPRHYHHCPCRGTDEETRIQTAGALK